MLYALYLVLVIILGRTGRTEFNFPATGAGTVVNIVLNLLLLPSMGIVGAGISLVASYAVVLVLMYVFTQRLFKVPTSGCGSRRPRARRSCWCSPVSCCCRRAASGGWPGGRRSGSPIRCCSGSRAS